MRERRLGARVEAADLFSQLLARLGRREGELQVALHHVLGFAVEQCLAAVEQQHRVAQAHHGGRVVRREQHGGAASPQRVEAREALALERLVAHRQHLVDHQHVGLDGERHRDRDAQQHAAASRP